MIFTASERAFLEEQVLGRLATIGPDGTPQNNPVGFTVNDETGTIDIGGRAMGTTRKFRNILANDRIAFVVDAVERDPWTVRGIEVRGRAEALTDVPGRGPHMSPEIIRIHPELIFSWGIEGDSMQRRGVT